MSQAESQHQQNQHVQHHPYSPVGTSFQPVYSSNPHELAQHNHHPGYPSSLSSNDPPLTQEEAESKRLRNTAASARFRAKKKRREQSLERSSREKRQQLQALETRISDLEAENRFLKGLIMTKRENLEAREEKESQGREGVQVVEGDRKGFERKDGVGTGGGR